MVAANNAHDSIPLRFSILGSQPASLDVTLQIEQPFELTTFNGRIRLASDSSGIYGSVTTLDVSPQSQITPASDTAEATLESDFNKGWQNFIFYLANEGTLSLPGSLDLPDFPNTKIEAVQESGATLSDSTESGIFLGLDISPQEPADPLGITSAGLAAPPFNLHATIDEAFATDLLFKFVKSGDVTRIVNENLGNSISVAATGGKVEFQNGSITVTINFKMPGACGGIATLHFTASLSGPPQVSNGNLSIAAQYEDISFDTTDEILCLLLSGWAFPIYAGFSHFSIRSCHRLHLCP